MFLGQVTAAIAFSAGNSVATMACFHYSRRKALLFSGAVNSVLSVSGLWWMEHDPLFATCFTTVASGNALLVYSLHSLKMRAHGPFLAHSALYAACTGVTALFFADRCEALYDSQFDV